MYLLKSIWIKKLRTQKTDKFIIFKLYTCSHVLKSRETKNEFRSIYNFSSASMKIGCIKKTNSEDPENIMDCTSKKLY